MLRDGLDFGAEGFEFVHGFATVKLFAAIWAFVEFNSRNNVFFPPYRARHAAAYTPNAFASTGGACANIEHCRYSARLALTRK